MVGVAIRNKIDDNGLMENTKPIRKIAVVTGASSGIGAATALRLAAEGYYPVITARRSDRLDDLISQMKENGYDGLAIPGDICDPETCHKVIKKAASLGNLEVVVANAGVGYNGAFDAMTDDDVSQMVNVNLMGVLRLVKEALPIMKEAKAGKIVIVASVVSRVASPKNAVYTAVKHAAVGFADALRLEVGAYGIRVISILPGFTKTEFSDSMLRQQERPFDVVKKFWPFSSSEEIAEVIIRRIKNPRAEVVIGGLNTLAVLAARLFPRALYFLIGSIQNMGQQVPTDESERS